MSLPNKPGQADELVQYLLGVLPPEDTERLDEASIVDDDIAARLRRVEDDLVDSYVRGQLSGDTLAQFESHYLASRHRRERVEFARKFLRAVDKVDTETAPVAVDAPPKVGGSKVLATLAVAATLSLAAGGALLLQNVRLGRGLREAQIDRVAVDQRARDLERQLKELRDANETATKELARARESATTVVREAATVALVLLPQTRSIGPVPTLVMPAVTEQLGFELRLEANDFPSYQVGLRDPAVNTVIWRSGWIAAKSSAGQSAVRVGVPARALKPQHYSLDLSGRRPAGGTEVVGSYAFEIVPQ
ncbi:MAG TPA: hypothetical protein VFI56_21565 [Vicinamibacterales bacterium]|jgi:hypothetical protein|nr:hypothetical protein [Vicinamibacterales bacterium]